METAKIFENGGSQAVRLPKKFRFSNAANEVIVQRLGDAVMLVPKDAAWQTFMAGLSSFTDDFMENGREADIPSDRNEL